MTERCAFLFVAMLPVSPLPPDAEANFAEYHSGAKAAMQRLGATMTLLAKGPCVEPISGTWGLDHVALERYGSLSQIQDFWSSAEYTAARPHRHGLVHMHFIVAVPGLSSAKFDQTGSAAYVIAVGSDAEPTSSGAPLVVAEAPDITVLEGSWPFEGRLIVERHNDALAATQAWQQGNATTAIVIPELRPSGA